MSTRERMQALFVRPFSTVCLSARRQTLAHQPYLAAGWSGCVWQKVVSMAFTFLLPRTRPKHHVFLELETHWPNLQGIICPVFTTVYWLRTVTMHSLWLLKLGHVRSVLNALLPGTHQNYSKWKCLAMLWHTTLGSLGLVYKLDFRDHQTAYFQSLKEAHFQFTPVWTCFFPLWGTFGWLTFKVKGR